MAEPTAPTVNSLSAPYWAAAGQGRLALPHCTATGRPFWPPAPSSPFRPGGSVDWRDVDPVGTLRSVVVYRRAFQQAFAGRVPYGIALVELDGGVRLLAHLSVSKVVEPGDLVRLAFAPFEGVERSVLCVLGAAGK